MNATSAEFAHVGSGPKSRISRRAFVGSAGAALALGGISGFPGIVRAAGGSVVVMAWENYVHAEIQKRFHDATGITVNGVAADSDQNMFTKLKAGGGAQDHLVFANAGFCPFYHDAGLIEVIDLKEIPASENLWPIFRTNTDFPYIVEADKVLLYPSMWASMGICWNIEQFQVPAPYSWKSLWDAPTKARLSCRARATTSSHIAGLALGVPRSEIYSMTGDTLKKAADYLSALKPFQISASSDLVTADAIRTGESRRGDRRRASASPTGSTRSG